MKKYIKFLFSILALIGLFGGGFRIANADVTTNFWVKQSDGIYTNEGAGLGLGAIHIGACYIGPGTGTPCTSAGAIGIGSPIIGGTPNSVLTVGPTGNLSQSTPSLANTFLEWNGSAFVWSAGGGGGTPANPNHGVQYNTGGVFDADALFTRNDLTNYTDILKNFDNPVAGTISGTMTPNYPVVGGVFSGTVGTTYTLTISGDNVVTLTYNTLVGGTLNVGDTITGITTGATGTLLSFTGTTALINTTAGDFTGETALSDTTSGASALVSLVTAENNAFNWTDGTTTVIGVLITGGAQTLNNGVIVGFPQATGYTLGQTATWTYIASVAQGGFQITPDVGGGAFAFEMPGSFIVSNDANKNLITINGAGDLGAILGVPPGIITNGAVSAVFNTSTGDSVASKDYYYDASQGGTASMRHETDVVNGTLLSSFVADHNGVSAAADDTVAQTTSGLSLQNSGSAQIFVNDSGTNYETGFFSGMTGSQILVKPVFTGTKDWTFSLVDNIGSDNVSLSFGNITDNDRFMSIDPATGNYFFGDKDGAVGGLLLDLNDITGTATVLATNLDVHSPLMLNAPLIYINSGIGHTRLGYNAGGNSSLLAGGQNTYVGFEAGFGTSGSLGQANTAVGYRAGYSLDTTGDGHVFVGNNAGDSVTTAQNIVAVGYGAGRDLTIQGDNTLLGALVGELLIDDDNVMVGAFAGGTATTTTEAVFVGKGAGLENTTGDNNVCIGYLSCDNNATGGSNVIIGSEGGFDTNRSSSIGLGRNVQVTADNQFVIGSGAHPILSGLMGDHTDANNGIAITFSNSAKTVEMGHLFGAGNNTKIRLNDTTGQQFVILDAVNLTQINSARILLNGSQQIKVTHVNDADHIIASGDYLVLMESLSAPRTVTVPDASTAFEGRTYMVKDASCLAGTHTITLDPAGTDTIDGAANFPMTTNCEAITMSSDGGTNWVITARNP